MLIIAFTLPGLGPASMVHASGHAEPPEVRIDNPENGASVSGTVSIEVRAQERELAVDRTELYIDGGLVTSSTAEEFTYAWDTAGLSGERAITATAFDVEGHSSSASITVTVSGSSEPPSSGPGVLSVAVNPDIVTGGDGSTGTVGLTDAAPSGGTVVALSSSNTAVATVPESVTVAAGQTTATFPVTTSAVSATTSVTITASAGGTSDTATLTVTAPSGGGVIDLLVIDPDTVVGGEDSQGTVTLAAAVSGDTVVTLTSSDETVATVPASVTVPAGALTATFVVTTFPNTGGTGLFSVIQGHAGGVSRGDSINTVAAPSGPAIIGLDLFPSTIGGGGSATGIVTFDATLEDGVRIFYTSSHPEIVQVPDEQQVIWSSTERAFRITTSPVAANTDVTITATAGPGGVGEATAVMTVTTDAPPAPDDLVIKKAQWTGGGRGGTIEVEAESSSNTAIIDVYRGGTDIFMLTLRPIGDGKYAGEQSFGGGSTDPGTVDAFSNLGGTDSADT